MIGNNPDRELIRQYLLGRLDDEEATEATLSEDILCDDALAEFVDSVEDEIMEEYLNGTLDSADRKSVEEYFLQPPERLQKLGFMRLLEQNFAVANQRPATSERVSIPDERLHEIRPNKVTVERIAVWRSLFWVYGRVAAVIVFGLAAVSYAALLQRKQNVLEHDLDREKARSASLMTQVSQLQPPIAALSLVSGRPRGASGEEEIPHLELRASTERIVVEVAVEHPSTGAFSVQLEAKDSAELIWKATLLPIVSDTGDARLVFDLPTRALHSGVYSVAVSEPDGSGPAKRYDFAVTTQK
jgi:hypothetical protein